MSTWAEFRNRCAATVQKIRDTKDDGVYAKLYAEDVGRFLRMMTHTDETWSDPRCAFESTEDP